MSYQIAIIPVKFIAFTFSNLFLQNLFLQNFLYSFSNSFSRKNKFKLLSWNVLHIEDKYQKKTSNTSKYMALSQEINTHEPDIVALQECSEYFIHKLPQLYSEYVWHFNPCHNNWYVVIGTKGHSTLFANLKFNEFASSGKGMISVKWNSHIVSSIHLPFFKKGACECFTRVLSTLGEDVLIAGDFNVCERENLPRNKQYWDCLEKLLEKTSCTHLKYDKNTQGTVKTLNGEIKKYDHLVYSNRYESSSIRCWNASDALTENNPSDHVPILYNICEK